MKGRLRTSIGWFLWALAFIGALTLQWTLPIVSPLGFVYLLLALVMVGLLASWFLDVWSKGRS